MRLNVVLTIAAGAVLTFAQPSFGQFTTQGDETGGGCGDCEWMYLSDIQMNVHWMETGISNECSGGGGHAVQDCVAGDGPGNFWPHACGAHNGCSGYAVMLLRGRTLVSTDVATRLAALLPREIQYDSQKDRLVVRDCSGTVLAIARVEIGLPTPLDMSAGRSLTHTIHL